MVPAARAKRPAACLLSGTPDRCAPFIWQAPSQISHIYALLGVLHYVFSSSPLTPVATPPPPVPHHITAVATPPPPQPPCSSPPLSTMGPAGAFIVHKVVTVIHVALLVLMIIATVLDFEAATLFGVACYVALVAAGIGLWSAALPGRNCTRHAIRVWYVLYAIVAGLFSALSAVIAVCCWILVVAPDWDFSGSTSNCTFVQTLVLAIFSSLLALVTVVNVVLARQLVPAASAATADAAMGWGGAVDVLDLEAGGKAHNAGPVVVA